MKTNFTTKTFAYLLLKGYQLAFKNKVDYLLNKLVHIVELILITNLLSAFYNNETNHKRSYGTHNFLKLTSNTTLNKALLLLTLLGLGVGEVMGQTSTKSGDWNDPTVWNTNVVPTSTGAVIITSNHIVTVTDDITCASITFNGSAGTLSVNNGITLTVTGNIERNHDNNNNVTSYLTGLGTISCGGSVRVGPNSPGSSLQNNRYTQIISSVSQLNITGNIVIRSTRWDAGRIRQAYFDINGGEVTLHGAITPDLPADPSDVYFRMSGGGSDPKTLILNNASPWATSTNINCPWNNYSTRGTFHISLTGTNSTVVYNREGDQTINRSGNSSCASSTITINYTNLTLAGSGVKTLPDRSAAQVSGTLSMQGTATLTTTGTLTYGASSTLEYKGSSSQTTAQGEFLTGAGAPLNLIIDNPNGVTLHAARTLRTSGANTLTLVNGTLNNSTQNLTLSNASSIIRSGGSLSAAPTFGTPVNITYNQHSGAITTGPELPTASTVLNNITVNNTNGVNLNANPTVNGNLTVNNSGVLNLGANTLNRGSAGGTLTLGDNTTLRIGGTGTFPINYNTHNIATTSTVNYNGANQEVALLNSSQSYGNLTLSGSGTKTFAHTTDTNIGGNFTVEGVTVTTPTRLNFNGPSSQSIAGLAYNNIAFSNAGTKTFTSNASVSPTSAITFSGTPGTVDFDGTGDNLEFVLQSTLDGTASVGEVPTGWTLNGRVRAERYIPAKRAWRLLTAPLKGATNNTIPNNWQGVPGEGLLLFSPSTYQSQTMTGYITGGSSPNIWRYNNGWQSIPNLSAEPSFDSDRNNAFLVFAVGHYGGTNITGEAVPTNLKPKGALITGDVNHSLVANQFKLIGNPYASPIDTEVMVRDQANSGSQIWLLDPTNGLGAYVTYDGSNWSVPTPSGNDKYIQSGQAFFIRRNSNSFTVKESHKVVGNSNTWFERNANNQTNLENSDRIRVLLYKQDTNNWLFADGALAVNSSSGNNNVDDTDATKISNFNESLFLRNGTTNLSIEYRALPQLGDIQPLRLTGTTNGSYQLRLYTENYTNSTIQPYLEDTQTTSIYQIPTDGSEIIVPFEGVVSNSSNPITRFRLVYQSTLDTQDPTKIGVNIYPNPVDQGYLNISLDNNLSATTYALTNLLGQEVQSGNLMLLDNVINVSKIPNGVYFITIKQNEKNYSKKIIIN